MRKECVAMLLAGGEGKRLGLMTRKLAKPAVPFGGKYRIIDFTLSNCGNSNIHTVGVLTQYSPLELNQHIGIGEPWGLNRQKDGVSILSPHTRAHGGHWYAGTADAIYQNIHFIDQYNPEHLLVISGDHIYQMNYKELLDEHTRNEADATISVMEVPWLEASRFGILNTDENLRIYEFEEKPAEPKNNLASMGIYMFKWSVLRRHLLEDHACAHSSHDFGKDIIPKMLAEGNEMLAYPFKGYWKDVGTIQSYWEANMDMLDEDLSLSLNNKQWRTYSNSANYPPHYLDKEARVNYSLLSAGCLISGTIEHSVLFEHVHVEGRSLIMESILQSGVQIGAGVVLERVIVMENVKVPDGMMIQTPEGAEPLIIDQNFIEQARESTTKVEGDLLWNQ
ncbi:glucose-1-phosphate adenylyltransferase [Shouchella shacheensis]|uniref:glucose-1-phosphate adenylyltransferase n=1 Tax=Shouchella shacheensis TaxID=1649580 RepID=UPI00073FF36D|nr:glucose-1-phosphate adenylyltransferase [Shouchella shacheensis]